MQAASPPATSLFPILSTSLYQFIPFMETRPSDERARKRSHSPSTRRRDHDHRSSHDPSSKRRRHHHHHHPHNSSSHQYSHSKPSTTTKGLPYNAPYISSHHSTREYNRFRPLFANYLSVQKNSDIEQLDEREVKGRWKRFVGRWNEGTLSEGWYEMSVSGETLQDLNKPGGADWGRRGERWEERRRGGSKGQREREHDGTAVTENELQEGTRGEGEESSGPESEDDFGPAPANNSTGADLIRRIGPSIPSLDELRERREQLGDDRREQVKDARFDRNIERKMQKERLDDLLPKAEAGSRERMLEKKREKAEVNREFKQAREGGGMEEVGDGELMGGGEDDGLEGFKKKLKEKKRAKNEREIRREEVLRARAAEREERMRKFREKEEKTMSMLKELARQRFGSG